jgi:phasin family protein
MFNTPEQFTTVAKTNVETLLEASQKAFAGVEKLVELNLQTARAALEDSADAAKAALTVKDAQELLALHAGLLQPAAEKAAAYGRQVYDIAAAAQAEMSKLAEARAAEAQTGFASLVDAALKNAPAGSENITALVQSAMTAANNAVESLQKTAKQAAGVAEANLQAMTQTATNAAKAAATVTPKARKAA